MKVLIYYVTICLFIISSYAQKAEDDMIHLDPENNFIEVEVQGNQELVIFTWNLSSTIAYTILQANTYKGSVTLSYNRSRLVHGYHTTGTNIGLVLYNNARTDQVVYLTNPSNTSFYVLLGLQTYDSNAPIPGACNMEVSIRIAPFLPTHFTRWMLMVDYPPASWPLNVLPPTCDGNPLQYDIYHLYLPETDTSRRTVFDNIKKMSSWKSIEQNGQKVNYYGQPEARIKFVNYIGTGRIVAVVVRGLTSSAAYVPTFSYGCTWTSLESNSCVLLSSVVAKIFEACLFFIGLFLTFGGHRFFKCQILLIGFCITSLITNILLFLLFDTSVMDVDLIVFFAGVIGGLGLLLLWGSFGVPIVPVFLGCLVLGFLFGSIVTYSPLADLEIFKNNLAFWLGFSCLVLVSPLLLISFPLVGSIVFCGFVGSYLFVFPLDQYLGSNLKYIILNALHRATHPSLESAIVAPPFQSPDLILAILWGVIALIGIIFQFWRERQNTRAPFPPPPTWPIWMSIPREFRSSGLQPSAPPTPPNENTPLLTNT